MQQSEKIAALAKALAKFQGEVEAAKNNGKNDHFKSKYADINAILDAIREPLASNGLSVIQMPLIREGFPVLATRVLHESGEWLEGEWPLNPVRNDPQGLGAASTYARRYSLQAALGLKAEDDDGETASGRGNTPHDKPVQQRQPTRSPAPAANGKPEDADERAECAKLLKLINGEIKRCTAAGDVDLILSDNADDIERIRKTSQAGKDQILRNAEEMKVFLRQKEAA